jgi:Uma2 family endonuclease
MERSGGFDTSLGGVVVVLAALSTAVCTWASEAYDREVNAAAENLGAMSYAEYLAFEHRAETKHEYIDGQVHAMAGGSTEHARLTARLIHQLVQALAGRPCEVFSSDLRVRNVESGRSTYPDVTVVCGRIERAPDDEHAATNPRLIAEVLSNATEAYDRGDKWRDYRRLASLQTYVLVSQTEPLVEVFRRSGDVWQYQAAGPGQRLELDEGLSLDIDALYHSGLTD